MSHNLHNENGWLIIGLDVHLGLPMSPPIPQLMPELNLLHPFTMGDKAEPSVLFDGVPAVAHTHTPKLLWPHLSLTVFDLLTPVHILFGKQRCCMPRSRVLLKGEPAACCRMQGHESINTDCWVAGMIPSSYIVNYGTVCTDPDPEDFDLAAQWLLFDNVLGLASEVVLRATHLNCRSCDCSALKDGKDELYFPEDVKIEENINAAIAARALPDSAKYVWFYEMVKTGGIWDYKNQFPPGVDTKEEKKEYSRRMANFGNYHFGVVAAAAGIPEQVALRAAGGYQIFSGTSEGVELPVPYLEERGFGEFGLPWDLEPSWASAYGDDPEDMKWVRRGYDYFHCCR